MPLTDNTIRKAKPEQKTTRLFDPRGLYLEISPNGGKWWRLKYRFGGKEKRLSLGVYPDCVERKNSAWESTTTLFQSWRCWAELNGDVAGSVKRFCENLTARGYSQHRKNTGRGFDGILLKKGIVTPRDASGIYPRVTRAGNGHNRQPCHLASPENSPNREGCENREKIADLGFDVESMLKLISDASLKKQAPRTFKAEFLVAIVERMTTGKFKDKRDAALWLITKALQYYQLVAKWMVHEQKWAVVPKSFFIDRKYLEDLSMWGDQEYASLKQNAEFREQYSKRVDEYVAAKDAEVLAKANLSGIATGVSKHSTSEDEKRQTTSSHQSNVDTLRSVTPLQALTSSHNSVQDIHEDKPVNVFIPEKSADLALHEKHASFVPQSDVEAGIEDRSSQNSNGIIRNKPPKKNTATLAGGDDNPGSTQSDFFGRPASKLRKNGGFGSFAPTVRNFLKP